MKHNTPNLDTRSTLLGRLKDLDDQRTWQEFFDTYWILLFNFVRRAGLSESESEEVVMDIVETVARKIEDFEYNRNKGRFKSWLLTIARFKLGDRFRQKKRQFEKVEFAPIEEIEQNLIASSDTNELEKIWNAEWQERIVDMALKRVKQQVGHKQYQIFYCYVIQEQDANEVANFLKVSRSQVYVTKNRVGKLFESELKSLNMEE